MRKVLIANRGEIAVRVARACKDAGLQSVAVYAEPDLDALHVRVADEAFALGGTTPGDSYLRIDKVLQALAGLRRRRGAPRLRLPVRERRVRAGRHRRRRDLDRPVPRGDRRPGRQDDGPPHRAEDRRPARPRHRRPGQGRRRGARLRRGARPARRHQGGLRRWRSRSEDRPHEGGDPRAVRVGRPRGRGRLRPRRVLRRALPRQAAPRRDAGARRHARQRRRRQRRATARCSAATRRSSRRRPRRSCPQEQLDQLYQASKDIIREAKYVGAGTCEFLVGADGLISFLEVNTRLQVEHPVTEEVTGVDLVREQFRIAEGEALSFTDPAPRGHSFEFRINGEDPGRGFLPAPGAVTTLRRRRAAPACASTPASSPARSSAAPSTRCSPSSSSPGRPAQEALERSAARPGRDAGRGHGDAAPVPPQGGARPGVHQRAVHRPQPLDRDRVRQRHRRRSAAVADAEEAEPRETVVVEVGGRRLEVSLPAGLGASAGGGGGQEGRSEAQGRRQGRRRCGVRRQPHVADAGHDRQGRRRGRRDRRGRRADRRPRGDEDGAAASTRTRPAPSPACPPPSARSSPAAPPSARSPTSGRSSPRARAAATRRRPGRRRGPGGTGRRRQSADARARRGRRSRGRWPRPCPSRRP